MKKLICFFFGHKRFGWGGKVSCYRCGVKFGLPDFKNPPPPPRKGCEGYQPIHDVLNPIPPSGGSGIYYDWNPKFYFAKIEDLFDAMPKCKHLNTRRLGTFHNPSDLEYCKDCHELI